MTAPTVIADHARTLPCTADPEAFQIIGPYTINGRIKIAAAKRVCNTCRAIERCDADVPNWPKPPLDSVVAGVFYDAYGNPDQRPTKTRT